MNCKNATPVKKNPSQNSEPYIQVTGFTKPFSKICKILIFLLKFSSSSLSAARPKPPPIPILPIPTSQQISWQLSEMALFLHFGPNTFTDTEWGSGHADPSVFNPVMLNPKQWVSVAKENGFERVILTAKHHDGFCLWPSDYTDYSVKSSPWRNGSGDVVGELAMAAKEGGIQLGLYLSPWDRHEPRYGKTLEYNEYYMAQMTELLTRYGFVKEVWLDGAKGEGEKDMEYYFDSWFSLIHQLQPESVIFSDAGPDTRWVGNEAGFSSATCWSLFNRSDAVIGGTDAKYSQGGDPLGHDWVPAECDVSIRPGWFWHPSQVPKSSLTLLDLYYKSVGRNCLLLLNVPPNSSGLISDEDVEVLKEFSSIRNYIFARNLVANAIISASSTRGGDDDLRFSSHNVIQEGIYSYWAPGEDPNMWILYVDFREDVIFNVVLLQEPIQMGQRVIRFHVDALTEEGDWSEVVSGTTVGYKQILLLQKVKSRLVRFVVDESRADPLIAYFGIYLDPFSIVGEVNTTRSNFNGSRVVQQVERNCSPISSF